MIKIAGNWYDLYILIKKCYENGDDVFNLGRSNIDKNEIRIIMSDLRRKYRCNNLNDDDIKLLKKINKIQKDNLKEASDARWMKNYECVKEYFLKHGNLTVPVNYIVCNKDGESFNLYSWLGTQRNYKRKNKLSDNRIKLLDKLYMDWDNTLSKKINELWYSNYLLAKAYFEEHGNLLVPKGCVVHREDGSKFNLFGWLNYQKRAYNMGNLSDEKIKLLLLIKAKLDDIEIDDRKLWLDNYKLAKAYYEKYGNLLIPQNYTVNNIKLGLWLSDQRCSKSLDKEKINLLDSINMQWSKNHIWNKHYNALKKYKEMYGTILMSNDFVFNYNNKSYELGQFLDVQRKVLEKDGIEYIVLDNLGMIWKDVDFVSLKEYIEKEYNDYLNNMIDTDRKDKLVKFGVFKYSDYDIVKNDFKELTKSIKTKK